MLRKLETRALIWLLRRLSARLVYGPFDSNSKIVDAADYLAYRLSELG
jgi:hypothetical protein